MLARLNTIFLFFIFALCASAATVVKRTDGDSVSCNANSGTQQCCNSLAKADDPVAKLLIGLLGIVLGPLDVQVGLTCNPITVIGAGTTQCNSQAVCCSGNNFGGLITIGCTPININV